MSKTRSGTMITSMGIFEDAIIWWLSGGIGEGISGEQWSVAGGGISL